MAGAVQHVVLALVLTGVLAYQAGALAAVLRSRRALGGPRPWRLTDFVWVLIPVAVVAVLAARSWIAAFDLGAPAMTGVEPVEISSRQTPTPVFHR